MTIDLLLMQRMMSHTEAAFDRDFTTHRLYLSEDRERFLDRVAPQIRAVATGGSTGLPRAVMDRLPALEIVAVNGVGTDAVDLVEAARRGIAVTTTPGLLTDDVADMAMGLMLATARRLCFGDRFVRAGHWRTGGPPLARKVTGKRLGILGLGQIGRAIARRAAAFDMSVAYTNRNAVPDVPYRFVPDLMELASSSDLLVIAAAGGPSSRGIVDRAVLDALGPESILINVARGSLVDEAALIGALAEGRLGGAGLDVFATEPAIPDAFMALDNVVLQPHQGSATVETRQAMGEHVIAHLRAQFEGRRVHSAA
jgi:hydroxypyruvate reductase